MRLLAVILLGGLSLDLESRVEISPELTYSAFLRDGGRQFNFWIGEWDVNLRTIQSDLTFQDSVKARSSVYSILTGKAILELWDSKPIKGFSLQYYNSISKEWEVWVDWPETNNSHLMQLKGGFRHGRGEFRDASPGPDGQSVTRVHSFTDITPFSLRWEDSYSTDNGRTWTRNWEMEYTRTAVEPKWPIPRNSVPTYVDGGHCDDERFRHYELLIGTWRNDTATFTALPVLDGCAVIGFLDANETVDEFVFLTFETLESRWMAAVLDDLPGTDLTRYLGEEWGNLAAADGAGSIKWAIAHIGPGGLGTQGDILIYSKGERKMELQRIGELK